MRFWQDKTFLIVVSWFKYLICETIVSQKITKEISVAWYRPDNSLLCRLFLLILILSSDTISLYTRAYTAMPPWKTLSKYIRKLTARYFILSNLMFCPIECSTIHLADIVSRLTLIQRHNNVLCPVGNITTEANLKYYQILCFSDIVDQSIETN